MSKSKNAITEIKKLMVQFGFIEENPTLLSFKLKDNTILQTEKLEVGKSISKINEAFEQVSLESGVYRIDNFDVEVKDGIIKTIKEIFIDAVLEDGTKISVEGEELVEGAKVVVVTEEGNLPAPDGIHSLEDGTKVETKDGMIVSVKLPEVLEEGVKKEEEVVDEEKKKEGQIGDEEMYQLLKDMMEKISSKMKKMEDKMNKVEAEFKSFKKEPASKPIPNGKTDFSKEINNYEESRIKAILELRNNK